MLHSRVDKLIRLNSRPCDHRGSSGHGGKDKTTVAAGDLTQVSPLLNNQLKGTDCHGSRCRTLRHKNHLRDTGPDGRNAKINIRETEYKREECIRPAPLHGPAAGSWQEGNEPSFFTKGLTVPK